MSRRPGGQDNWKKICCWFGVFGIAGLLGLTWFGRGSLEERYNILRLRWGGAEAKREAARRLGELGSARAVPYLVEELAKDLQCEDLRVAFDRYWPRIEKLKERTNPHLDAVRRVGRKGIGILVHLLGSEKREERCWVLFLLTEMGPPAEAVEKLREILEDSGELPITRRLSAYALERVGEPATPSLISAVKTTEGQGNWEGTAYRGAELRELFPLVCGAALRAALRTIGGSHPELVKDLRFKQLNLAVPLGSLNGQKRRIFVFLPRPAQDLHVDTPTIVVTDVEFRVIAWKELREWSGWLVFGLAVTSEEGMVELECGRRRGEEATVKLRLSGDKLLFVE